MKANNKRQGRCFELSGKHILDNDGILVHGFVTDKIKTGYVIIHAWVEDGDKVFDAVLDEIFDKGLYYALFDAEPVHTYNKTDASKWMLQTGHFGYWEEMDESKINFPV